MCGVRVDPRLRGCAAGTRAGARAGSRGRGGGRRRGRERSGGSRGRWPGARLPLVQPKAARPFPPRSRASAGAPRPESRDPVWVWVAVGPVPGCRRRSPFPSLVCVSYKTQRPSSSCVAEDAECEAGNGFRRKKGKCCQALGRSPSPRLPVCPPESVWAAPAAREF